MSRRLAFGIALAVLAASCGGSSDVAVIERQVSDEAEPTLEAGVCGDVEAFALGSLAGEGDLVAVIDELARIAALLRANDALPPLADVRAALTDGDTDTARGIHDAAEVLDHAAFVECEIPVFTAMYVSSSFASCYGRAPIAAGTLVPDTEGCDAGATPEYLPCFDAEGGYLPVDCRSGEGVVLRSGEWVANP